MAGRTRRVRILVLLVFGVTAIVLYTRRSSSGIDYTDYIPNNVIGGGSVIRPNPKEEVEQDPPAAGPLLEGASIPVPLPTITKAPPAVEPDHRPTSKTTTKATESSSSSGTAAPPKGPPKAPPPQVPAATDDLPYQVGEGRVEVEVNPSPTTTALHWSKVPEHFPIASTIQLPTGTSIPLPRVEREQKKLAANGVDKERLAIIKASAEHAWKGYREYAWAADEVRPISGKKNNPFNGWGATLVDSLDTLWVMGLKSEFEEAVAAVKNIDFTTSPRSDIPVFETTIRYLGGLIAAYDVSERKYIDLLDKAVELAEVLFSIFDTPNRMPQTFFRWRPSFASQPHRAGTRVILAEIGTLSLEFTRLAQLTGEPRYYDAIARITDEFEKWQNNTRLPGMWPTQFDASGCGKPAQMPVTHTKPNPDDTGNMISSQPVKAGEKVLEAAKMNQEGTEKPSDVGPSNSKRQLQQMGTTGMDVCLEQGLASTSKNSLEVFTLSGASDSMYEYLPKEYILLGGQVEQYKTMYLDSAATFIEKLLYRPMTKDERNILMTGELKISPNYSQPIEDREYVETFKPEAAHLACFAGGMFAMGGVLFGKEEHVEIGAKLTDGCIWAYNVTQTGIMPEGAELLMCEETWGECKWNETAWWKALDPYAETRTKLPDPVSQNIGIGQPHHAAADVTQATHPADPDFQPKVDLQKKEEVSAANVAKRQLGEAALDESKPPQPQPASAPVEGSSTTLNDLGDNVKPVYVPEKPVSHEQYVQKKIEEDRLPPGYTRMTSKKYILRPEAIESVFYMYRITGNKYWRDAGWDMFTSIDQHTRAPLGNSAIDDITKSAPEQMDQMESFWLAETLKYFYLLYDDPENWSLDQWVLNTEAHLFRRPKYEFVDE